MSIEGKHAYRFEYLRSGRWRTVRLEALVREMGKCQICGEESISNDAHHVWYPDSIWDTTTEHLVILCRPCHELLHAILPECKTRDEGLGREKWISFRNAMEIWSLNKRHGWDNEAPTRTRELREAYKNLKAKYREVQRKLQTVLARSDKRD